MRSTVDGLGEVGPGAMLAAYGLDDRTEEINRLAVEAVREVVDGRAYVSGSCGPCGRTLLPYGDAEPDDVRAGFGAIPRGFYTIMGVDVPSAAAGLLEAGANLMGSNCGNGIENMVAIAREFRACTDAPMLIQSNAGLPELIDGEVVYSETPEFMAAHAAELVELGVQVIGGCCGTTPEHVRAIREALRG